MRDTLVELRKRRGFLLVIDDEELFQLVNKFPGDDVPIVSGSALLALKALMKNPNIKCGEDKWVDRIYELLDLVDKDIPILARQTDLPFQMSKVDKGRGMVLAKLGS
ncbi:hypothetical protein SUGI_0546710 [Cryptomeria japonica]|nr:hypothetical protein SUGI_0546710 [Cryptomeria japonica]